MTASLTSAAVGLLAAGCGSGTSSTASGTPTAQVTHGGTLVLGATQEPGCADPYASCFGSAWGAYMMSIPALPQAFLYTGDRQTPTPLLAGEPTLKAGPPQQVIYRINPRAVWSDGQPITATDFKYTFDQSRSLTPEIQGVDDSDPHTAVVTFGTPFANWRAEFAPILPSHILQGKDRTTEMRNGYTFSGGPWIIDHWTRGQEVKLVRNPNYWGKKPNLDAVVFKIITDTPSFLAAYTTGQLDMVYVQGAGADARQLKTAPSTHFEAALGLSYESLSFNTQKPPVDSLAVRQALAYATDRDAIASQLLGPLLPGIKPSQAFMSPANHEWYSEAFKRYTHDLGMVTKLMTSDGWSRGADSVWMKAGTRAVIELATTAGNQRRELTEQILQSQWKQAGFDTTLNNSPASTLFGSRYPKGDFQVSNSGRAPASTDPGLCKTFCSQFIPTQANGFLGGDITRVTSATIDAAWTAVTGELDQSKRVQLVHHGQQALADEVPVLPLHGLVDVVAYNSAKVGGPVTFNPTDPFFNLEEWYCKAGCH